jgi:hypothetical protein
VFYVLCFLILLFLTTLTTLLTPHCSLYATLPHHSHYTSLHLTTLPHHYASLHYHTTTPQYTLPHHLSWGNDPVSRLKRKLDFKIERRKFWKIVLFTLFLIYPSVSATILRFFVCRDVNGVWLLNEDFSIQCYDDEW